MQHDTYARFHADPTKVKVSLRTTEEGYIATVSSRTEAQFFTGEASSPASAVKLALYAAKLGNLPGLDLGLDSAYDHPWGTPQPPPLKNYWSERFRLTLEGFDINSENECCE